MGFSVGVRAGGMSAVHAAGRVHETACVHIGNLFMWNNRLSHSSYKDTGGHLTEIALTTCEDDFIELPIPAVAWLGSTRMPRGCRI